MDLSFPSSHFGGTIENDEFPLPTFPIASSSTSSSPEPVINSRSNRSINNPGAVLGDQFVCEICNKRCVSRENLRNHRRHVHPKKCYACQICQKVFKSTSSLRRHASVHASERPYACSFCGRNYSCLFNCRVHERSHSEAEKNILHNCNQCSKAFKSSSALVAHKNRAHVRLLNQLPPDECHSVDEITPVFPVQELNLPVFPDYAEMPVDLSAASTNHHRSTSSPPSTSTSPTITNPDGTFSCGSCGKTFQTKSLLSYHRRNVHPSVLHSCHECGKAFKSKSHLRRHGRVHSGERPFPCGFCSRRYSDARHVREHHAKFHGISSDLSTRTKAANNNNRRNEQLLEEKIAFGEEIKCDPELVEESSSVNVNNTPGLEQVFFGGYFSTDFEVEVNHGGLPSSSFAPLNSTFVGFTKESRKNISQRQKSVSNFGCSICQRNCTNLAALRRHIIRRHVNLRVLRCLGDEVAVPSCRCPRCGIFTYRPPATLGWHLRMHLKK